MIFDLNFSPAQRISGWNQLIPLLVVWNHYYATTLYPLKRRLLYLSTSFA